MTPYFFGYGSLVNRATHSYPDAHPAHLQGWRRAWIRSAPYERVFLSVVPDAGSTISGLIAAVPDDDWAALDARETGYARIGSGGTVRHPLSSDPVISHYAVPTEHHTPTGAGRILLSYIDVVVQGFLQEFGEDGVAAFFDTTDHWDIPIVNDRAAPEYPRHQPLSAAQTVLVDHHLKRLAAQIK